MNHNQTKPTYMQEAEKWIAQNRFTKAIECLNIALNESTSSMETAEINVEIAICHRELGHSRDAITHYLKAIENYSTHHQGKPNADCSGTFFQIGTFFENCHRPKKAILYFQKSLENLDNHSEHIQMIKQKITQCQDKLTKQ